MLSEKLKKLRTEKGLHQKEIAENIGVSITMISNYERGIKYPSRNTLIRIAKFYNVSMDYLLSGEDLIDYVNTNTVYEQIKDYIREYEYEIFKKTKNNEDVTELNKILNILKVLDNRSSFEAYSNADKIEHYNECLMNVFDANLYFNKLFNTIVNTIDNSEIDIDKLHDEAVKASKISNRTIKEIVENSKSSPYNKETLNNIKDTSINIEK